MVTTINVINPSHYRQFSIQPIEIAKHLDFCMGNVVKYIFRAPFKNKVQDCEKARQYLQWEYELRPPFACLDIFSTGTLDKQVNTLLYEIARRDESWAKPLFNFLWSLVMYHHNSNHYRIMLESSLCEMQEVLIM